MLAVSLPLEQLYGCRCWPCRLTLTLVPTFGKQLHLVKGSDETASTVCRYSQDTVKQKSCQKGLVHAQTWKRGVAPRCFRGHCRSRELSFLVECSCICSYHLAASYSRSCMTALPCWQDGFARNHPFWDPRPFQRLRCVALVLHFCCRSWSWAVARAALDSLQQHWEQRPGASQTDAVSLRPGQVVLTDRSERALHVVQQSAKERDAVWEQKRCYRSSARKRVPMRCGMDFPICPWAGLAIWLTGCKGE